MPYYRGDYYMGRRPRGDGWIGALVGAAGGFLTGGLPGAIAGGVAGYGRGGKAAATGGLVAGSLPQGGGLSGPVGTPPTITLPGGIGVNPGAILPGGAPFLTGTMVPRGYHWNKSAGYGPQGRYEKGTYLVKNRSLNPLNPRALRRAVRREHGFVGVARRVLKGTGISIGRKTFARKAGRKR